MSDDHAAPSPDELAAILAAVELLWPRPALTPAADAVRTTSWRFSGRWWSRPSTARRERPWIER